ncbi:DUF4913 domain-containing protein [Nocardioides sp. Bht2]|uniref:DUF4913 domain-containing protein n=1 Tax=Nocardioides sp. Bht2 TaxID=3392297 RepID=UPI0039B5BCA3
MTDEISGEDPQPFYTSVVEFVNEFLAVVYARRTGMKAQLRWCSEWWRHPEALSRLEGLWKAFEVLRLDPGTGTTVWWRDYADPTMSVLLDPNGTFAECGSDEHKAIPDLPVKYPESDIFD